MVIDAVVKKLPIVIHLLSLEHCHHLVGSGSEFVKTRHSPASEIKGSKMCEKFVNSLLVVGSFVWVPQFPLTRRVDSGLITIFSKKCGYIC